jgi:S-(hydroxymethyl)glutathione dehydrogenase / alcohol dehydrogenase
MRAVVLQEYNTIPQVLDVEPLPLGPHDVRVEVGASGVCHSDLSATHGQYRYTLPIVMGHEGAGHVVEVGAQVSMQKPGDRVIASWRSSCGACWQCVRGRQHLCEASAAIASRPRAILDGSQITAYTGLGTMAELMTVNEANLIKVETELPDEQLALIGCGVTTGVGAALWTAQVEPGASVAVFGCGGVGLSVVQGARVAGASQIIAIDPVADKRRSASGYGATSTVDPADGDPVEQIRSLTGGRGVEYSFEAVGLLSTMRQAYEAAARGCAVVFVGALRADLELSLPANALHAEGKRILGSSYGSAQVRRDMPRLIALAESGLLELGSMISRRLRLEEIGDALHAIDSGEGVRSMLIP